jgi:hypothetical protein
MDSFVLLSFKAFAARKSQRISVYSGQGGFKNCSGCAGKEIALLTVEN